MLVECAESELSYLAGPIEIGEPAKLFPEPPAPSSPYMCMYIWVRTPARSWKIRRQGLPAASTDKADGGLFIFLFYRPFTCCGPCHVFEKKLPTMTLMAKETHRQTMKFQRLPSSRIEHRISPRLMPNRLEIESLMLSFCHCRRPDYYSSLIYFLIEGH